VFDAGEFKAEIRSIKENGQTSYGFFDSTFAGLPLTPGENTGGNLTITIGSGVYMYIFTQK
jgi:hypothetical protein